MKKKILFLSPLPPPHYGSALSSHMCLNILENSEKFEIKNLKLNYSENISDIGKFNLKKIIGFLKTKSLIREMIKNFRPDLIYFVPATSSLGFQRDYLFLREIKKNYEGTILIHLRSRVLDRDWIKKSFKNRFSSMISKEKVIILGEELMHDIHDLVPNKNIHILPNAIKNEVSEKEFNQILRNREKESTFNLLFLSNMDLSKGWMKLLQACVILKNKEVDFKCNFVGEFPSKNEEKLFYKFVKNNNLSKKVFYLGKKTGADKINILKISDILVFPTEYPLETFGRVILEGMMFGLPVIANGIATIPSIISDRKTGFVLEENSPEEISKHILNLKDAKIRRNFGIEGRKKFLKNYELKNYSKKFIKIIESS